MEKNYKHILVGTADQNEIYIEFGEYLKILKFAKAGATDGSRGVLLGSETRGKTFIYKVVEAVYSGDETLESPTFSPDSWGRICAEIKQFYPTLKILGQFSTHTPVKPIRTDYIMQDKFFNKESKVLFIFDPTDNDEKMYIYNGREFEVLNGFYIFDRFEKQINLSLRESIVRPLCREYEMRVRLFEDIKKRIRKQNNINMIVFIIFTLLTVFSIVKIYEHDKHIYNLNFSDGEKFECNSEFQNLGN